MKCRIEVLKIIAVLMLSIVIFGMFSIKDIVTNKDIDKMEKYSVYVSPYNVDIEFTNGYGIVIGNEGINILPKI